MCAEAGVIILYLPPYSPDMNPIEQSFAQLKSWMRRNQRLATMMHNDFESFINLAMSSAMKTRGARGHFKKCGYTVEDLADGEETSDYSSNNNESDSE